MNTAGIVSSRPALPYPIYITICTYTNNRTKWPVDEIEGRIQDGIRRRHGAG